MWWCNGISCSNWTEDISSHLTLSSSKHNPTNPRLYKTPCQRLRYSCWWIKVFIILIVKPKSKSKSKSKVKDLDLGWRYNHRYTHHHHHPKLFKADIFEISALLQLVLSFFKIPVPPPPLTPPPTSPKKQKRLRSCERRSDSWWIWQMMIKFS